MWLGIELALGIYAATVGSIFAFQRYLMYYPIRSIAAPDTYGLQGIREIFLPSSEGIKLQVWVREAKADCPTLVYFHGNAEHLGTRAAKFSAFVDAGFGLVAVSYRGFGKSAGQPSEKGIYDDARAAIAYARNTLHVPDNKFVYFGESLGSGVAVQMALERPPGLLVLEAAYTSVETRSAELYPFVLGVRNLVLDKYDSLTKIARVHCPLLMLHGAKDPTIPLAHGRTLFAAANEPKELIVYPEVHHADFSNEQLVVPLVKAAKKYKLL